MKLNVNFNKAELDYLTHIAPENIQTKVKKAIQRSQTQPPIKTLQPMTWYVADVSFRNSNPIHRCIAFHRTDGQVELISSYELEDMPVRESIENLAYFYPVREIPDMESPSFGLPKDRHKVVYIKA